MPHSCGGMPHTRSWLLTRGGPSSEVCVAGADNGALEAADGHREQGLDDEGGFGLPSKSDKPLIPLLRWEGQLAKICEPVTSSQTLPTEPAMRAASAYLTLDIGVSQPWHIAYTCNAASVTGLGASLGSSGQ